MQAFHGKAELKAALLAEVEKHEAADQIVSGTYGRMDGEKWVGCAVGCSLHSLAAISGRTLATDDHSLYEPEAGVPQAIARLQDAIFEGLHADQRKAWPHRFWSAVPVGADLSRVQWKFLHWLLTRSGIGAFDDEYVRDAVQRCAIVLEPLARGEVVDVSAAWSAAESAARCAAWSAESAARSAAESAESAAESAESAAWSAAESAESAAWSAARCAERSAAESAESAESAAWSTMADQLVLLMEAAP